MGVTAKTLLRLVSLHQSGFLKDGDSVIELGTQELQCSGMENQVRDMIGYFSERNAAIKKAELYSEAEIRRMADQGLFGRLLTACGFEYRALDIFDAENTILFDLNIHEPADALREKFDLVTNFGTTEHVINQYQAMKTVHELTRTGGIIYHDVPLAGYHVHGYFSYNPLLFMHLADANGYRIIMQHYSRAASPAFAPAFMTENGYPEAYFFNCGIEFIFQKTSSAPFRMPLETRTSLGAAKKALWGKANPYADRHLTPEGESRNLAPSFDHVSGWDLQREVIRRYRRKLARLFRLH